MSHWPERPITAIGHGRTKACQEFHADSGVSLGILAIVADERGLRGVLKSAGIALVTLLAVDAGVFRTGLYDYCVELDSSVGGAVQAVYSNREDSTELVAVVGDSRVAEGFAERVFDDVMRGKDRPLRALNLGIPGSSLRVSTLLLEQIDPQADRFRFVVIPLGQFVGRDQSIGDPAARLSDLSFLGPILSLDQASSLANSYPDFPGQQAAWLGSIFKSFAYRYDIRAGLADPMSRTRGRWRLMQRHEASHSYEGRPENVVGIRVEGDSIVGYPSVIPDYRRDALHQFVFGTTDPAREQARERYRTEWLGRVIQRYAGTRTEVIVIRLPSTVLQEQGGGSDAVGAALSHFDKQPHVHVVPVSTTAYLQSPEFFCDTTHFNRQGRRQWAQRLGEVIAGFER